MMKAEQKEKLKKIIAGIVLLSLIISIIFLIIRMLYVGSADSNYVLMLFQCIVGVIVFFIPNIALKQWRLEIPSGMYIAYVVFLYCAIYLGEVRQFYYLVPHWDVILHFFSAMMLGALGFSVVSLLNNKLNLINLSPVFVALFSVCFAITMGTLWEIYEFTFDGLLQMNMQKFALQDGTLLTGRAALMDTMKDLCVDTLGAFITACMGYISLKYRKNWLKDFLIIRKAKKSRK